jgi:hypothetical protein
MSTNLLEFPGLDLQAAAKHSRRGIGTIRRRIYDGSLTAVKDGNKYFIAVSELNRVFAPVPDAPNGHLDDDLEAAIAEVVSRAPKFTPAQIARLSAIFNGCV